MPTQIDEVVQHLRRATLRHDEAGLTDGQLLGRFIEQRDEAAVAAIVRRHGPMVWGVCRRIVRTHHDAEDAFQATFLVLVRKAGSVRQREMVGNWLYGVAHQTALKARATAAKQFARERQVVDMPQPAAKEPELSCGLQAILDQELSRLPEKYRVAIVLCDLEGKTRKGVARQLGLPEGTLAGRLTRGRAMLAKCLARHGLAVSGGTLAAALSQQTASAYVPTSVMTSTIKAVSLVAVGQAAATGAISVKVTALTEGVLKAMLLTKFKVAMVVILVVAAFVGAAGVIYQAQGAGQPKTQGATQKENQPAPKSASADTAEKENQPAPKQPKTFRGRLGYVKSSDDKQSVIGFSSLDDYYAELDNRGVPRGNLPAAKEVEVLIDGKKAKITDLAPGDKITFQLSPDNQSVTKIETALRPRLDALEKEADALRQRIQRLEKGK
jgi:RNA polymerase sigma factor (sigma-70 family)